LGSASSKDDELVDDCPEDAACDGDEDESAEAGAFFSVGRLGSSCCDGDAPDDDVPEDAVVVVGSDGESVDSPGFFNVGRFGSLCAAGGVPDDDVVALGVEPVLELPEFAPPPEPDDELVEEEDPLEPGRRSTGRSLSKLSTGFAFGCFAACAASFSSMA
jgi:hypothetical protein